MVGWPLTGFSSKAETHHVVYTVYGTGIEVPIEYVVNGKSHKETQTLPWTLSFEAEPYELLYLSVSNPDVKYDINSTISVDNVAVKTKDVPKRSTLGLSMYAMPASSARPGR